MSWTGDLHTVSLCLHSCSQVGTGTAFCVYATKTVSLDRFAEAEDLLIQHYGVVAQSEPEVMFLW